MKSTLMIMIGILLILAGIYITMPKRVAVNGKIYTITLIIDYGKKQEIYHLNLENTSLFDIMKRHLNISYKNYSFGVFITCINNICQTNNTYWLYYVDGNLANVGVSNCYVGNCIKNNSVIIWKYQGDIYE